MIDYFIIIFLIFFSALFSGLTIGFLGLDKTELERKSRMGDKKVSKILQVRKNGNLLLVVLLLGNVVVNSILSVFLGDKFSGIMAVLFSTILIVIFGEILPQAIFYRHAISVGYKFVPVVKFFMIIFYPMAWPIAKFLDKVLGKEEETVWSKKELKEIIKDHEDSDKSAIDGEEEDILLGALSFSDKKAREIMTPKNVVFALNQNNKLDLKLLRKIVQTGHTRIPLYRKSIDNITGFLNIKSLLLTDEEDELELLKLMNKNIISVLENDTLDDIFNKFIKKKTHMAQVKNIHGTFLGILTMEDIIEEIIQKEIMDETDRVEDMRELSKTI